MKRGSAAIAAAITLLCVSALATVVVRQTAASAPSPHAETTHATPYRVLREWNGKLAVFLPESSTPETVYEVWVSTLPEEEQARLHAGVEVAGNEELLSLLEDYTG